MCHRPPYSPSLLGASCLEVSGGNHWKSCGVCLSVYWVSGETRRRRAGKSSSTPFRGESGLSASPLRRVVLPRAEPGHRSHGSALHGHAQRVPGLCKNVAGRTEVVNKVRRDGGGNAGTPVLPRQRSRSRRLLDGSGQVRRMDLKFLRSPPCRASSERLSSVSAGNVSGPLQWVAAAAMMGGNDCERRRVCGDARDPVRGLLEAQRIVQSPVGRSSFSCPRHSLGEVHGKQKVYDTTLQPISNSVISESRCRTKLHVFSNKRNVTAKMVGFFLLLDGSDQLVGGQIARLSSSGIVVLSGVLSPGFDLKSSLVRDVLRGWIGHGDIAAVWMTQPLTLSTVACLLKAYHQANVVGFHVVLNSDTPRQSLEHWATNNYVFQQVPVDVCAFGLPFKKRFTLFSVNVPVHLQLARRCDNSGHGLLFCFQNRFLHRSHRVRYAVFVAPSSGG